MILSNLTERRDGAWRRISMDVAWEDSPATPQTLYFEAEGETAELMHPRADGFAIACLPLAEWMGEKRLRVEAPLCTRLRSGQRSQPRFTASGTRAVRCCCWKRRKAFSPLARPPSDGWRRSYLAASTA